MAEVATHPQECLNSTIDCLPALKHLGTHSAYADTKVRFSKGLCMFLGPPVEKLGSIQLFRCFLCEVMCNIQDDYL